MRLHFAFFVSVMMATSTASAQTRVQWLAHDLSRPHPPVVTPGKLLLPVPAPSDAIILFDGKDLATGVVKMGGRHVGDSATERWNPCL